MAAPAGSWRTFRPSFIRPSPELFTCEPAHTARAPGSSRVVQVGIFVALVQENRRFQGDQLGLFIDHVKQQKVKMNSVPAQVGLCACSNQLPETTLTL